MSQQWRAVGNTVSDLTSLKFERKTSCSRDEHVTTRPTGWYHETLFQNWQMKDLRFLETEK